MKEPTFLTFEEILALHSDQIELYGGARGLRDAGLLSSALAMPEAAFGGQFLHTTIPEMAAAYLFHLTQNHPFLDGNKRVGLAAALAFLGLNDLCLEVADDALAELVLSVARGERTKAEVAVFLKRHCRSG